MLSDGEDDWADEMAAPKRLSDGKGNGGGGRRIATGFFEPDDDGHFVKLEIITGFFDHHDGKYDLQLEANRQGAGHLEVSGASSDQVKRPVIPWPGLLRWEKQEWLDVHGRIVARAGSSSQRNEEANVANEPAAAAGLEKLPEALKNRRRAVELSDGSRVTIEKWSWVKFNALWLKIGDISAAQEIAEASVIEQHRDLVKDLAAEDILRIHKAAREQNMTEEVLGNVHGLLSSGKKLTEAITKDAQ